MLFALACVVLVNFALRADATNWNELVPLPGGLKNQNGKTYLRQSTVKEIFGTPCAFKTSCQSVTNPKLKPLIVLESVGKFRVTGLKPAVDRLRLALSRVKEDHPTLYEALGTAGMLCCRAVRGSASSYSNHAWGAAIDFKINGILDPRRDAKTQQGLLTLYPYMAEVGFYWAAGYSAKYEDAMHFEISEQTMRTWAADGTLFKIDGPGISDCTWPVLSQGQVSYTPPVYALQYLLKNEGFTQSSTGYFGSVTTGSVKAFQARKGLKQDGIVGKNTWTAIWGGENLARGSRNYKVHAVQDLLNRVNGEKLTVDGIYGGMTVAAVQRFQTAKGFSATGTVNEEIFKGLLTLCRGIASHSFPPANSSLVDSAFEGDDDGSINNHDSTESNDKNKENIALVVSLASICSVLVIIAAAFTCRYYYFIQKRRNSPYGRMPEESEEFSLDTKAED